MHLDRCTGVFVGAIAICIALLAAQPVAAQGSATDYERARTHAQRFGAEVPGARIDVHWLAPDSLIARRARADGWEFVLVDARRAQVERAFDHEAVATLLGTELERELDPARLGLRVLALDADAATVLVEGDARAFRVARDGSSATALDPTAVPGATLSRTARRRSVDRGGETRVLFVNGSSGEVDVVWLARDGAERSYATLAPGARHDQHTFVGHTWLVRRADGGEAGPYEAHRGPGLVDVRDDDFAKREPADGAAPGRSPDTSPDGRWQVVANGAELHLVEVATSERSALHFDSPWAGERTGGVHWSADSARFAVRRVLPAEPRKLHLVESTPQPGEQPVLHTYPYSKPGDALDVPRVVLFDVASRREVPIDRAVMSTPLVLDVMTTSPDGSELWLRYDRRGHEVQRVLALEFATARVRVLVEEAPPNFVDTTQKTWWHFDRTRGELLWASERSGWNHLYAVDPATSDARPLTSGEWVVRAVDRVDEVAGVAWIRALGAHADQDPYHVHFGRVDLVRGGVTWVTSSDGTHEIEFGPKGDFLVATWSRVDQPPVHEVRRVSNGALVLELSRARVDSLTARGWCAPERFVAKGRDGATDIFGVIHRPTNFDASRSHPVIEAIYAGPHGHFVPKAFATVHDVHELTELGFVVVQIDGMGTNWRSRAFHDVCWRNLGDSGFPDRIAWLRAAAATRPWMDLERVGIYGGSAGGQSALRALLAHGDFYLAAAADCGCHDNRLDKTWWNEAWMGWPVGPHYADQSNVTQAHRLTGRLLLTVGELDRNVDPASTMQVVDALIRADKDFDLLVIPGAGHGAGEGDYARRRRQDFFVRHLLGVEPRGG